MDNNTLIEKSKWLSKHLRHEPERAGLSLETGGWVRVDDLLDAARRHDMALSREQLHEVVARSDKQRFAFNDDQTKIRANQGHSVEVDLQLQAQTPPATLFHGTGAQNRVLLETEGLKKMRRHHVHLSLDQETAMRVGGRHGKPLVFRVDVLAMHADGFEFFQSENGVWLVDAVPPQYLKADD